MRFLRASPGSDLSSYRDLNSLVIFNLNFSLLVKNLHILLPLLIASVLASCVPSARRHFVLQNMPADSIRLFSYDAEEYAEKYDGHDGVFINVDRVIEHAFAGEDWVAFMTSSLRFMILNPEAEWLTTFVVRIDPGEKLINAWVNVLSPDGTVRQYGVEDMKAEKNSDGSVVYRFAYPDVQVGTVIDEGFDVRYSFGPMLSNFEFDLQYDVPAENVTTRFIYPNSFTVRTKDLGPDRKLETTFDNSLKGARAIVYEGKDIPALPDEPYAPYHKEVAEYMHVAITGAYSTTFLPSWSKYADNYTEYVLDRESFWRDRAGDVLEEIVDEEMSDFEKMDAIVGWVYDNIEVEPVPDDFDYNDMIKQGKGSPPLIAGLTRLMLQKSDIDASFLLVHSAEDGYFDEDFITYGELTTPAVYTKIDDREYVLIPYVKNFPIDHIPDYMQGQEALAINEKGFNGFVTVPYGTLGRNTITENYELEIDEEGLITITEEKELDGTAAYAIRRALEDITEEDLEDLMESLVSYEEGEVELDSWEVKNQDDYKAPLSIVLKYDIDNLVTITPEEVIVQTGGLLSPVSSTGTKVETDKRVNPIRIYSDERLVKNITLRYPSEWRFNTDLKTVDYTNDFGELKVTWTDRGGETEINMSRTLRKSNEAAERFPELMDIVGSRSRYLNVPALIFAVD